MIISAGLSLAEVEDVETEVEEVETNVVEVEEEEGMDIMMSAHPASTLVEELNLSGDTLLEITGGNPKLSGLKEISARVYELFDLKWDDWSVNDILNFYEDELKEQGWKVMFRKLGANKALLNLLLEKEGKRDGLFMAHLTPGELTLVKLMGRCDFSDLKELIEPLQASWDMGVMRPFDRRPKEPLWDIPSPSSMGIPPYLTETIDVGKLEQALLDGNTDDEIYLYLGIGYERLGDFEQARKHYHSILEKYPHGIEDWIYIRTLYGTGKCNEQLGEIKAAKKVYAQFIDRFGDDDYFTPAIESGLIRFEQISRQPLKENVEARKLLAEAENMVYNERQLSNIEPYEQILEKYPDTPYAASAQFMLGVSYGWTEDIDMQISELEKAAENYPNAAVSYYLGKAYQQVATSEHRALSAEYARIRVLNPTENGQIPPFKFSVDSYRQVGGEDEEALDNLKGFSEKTIEQYRILLDEYPDSNRWHVVDADFNIGKCLQLLGKNDVAIEHYEQFMEKYKEDKDQAGLYASARILLERLKRDADKLPFLGVGLRKVRGNIIVTKIVEGTAAEEVGLQEGDVIIAVNGEIIKTPKGVVAAVIKRDIGDTITLIVVRNGERLEIKAMLGKRKLE